MGFTSVPQRLEAAPLAKTKSARVKLVPFPVEIFRDCFVSGILGLSQKNDRPPDFRGCPPFENRKEWGSLSFGTVLQGVGQAAELTGSSFKPGFGLGADHSVRLRNEV